MPSRKIEQQLEALNALRQAGVTESAALQLRRALQDRVNLVVAKAAAMSALLSFRALIPDLQDAFERLLKNPEKDPQCWGKNALAKALKDLGHDESATFVHGLRHVQMEPVWGNHVDTAGTLRSICVLALLQCADLTREDKLWHQMRALTDFEPVVRLEAARALEEMDGREAAFLLRIKARMGDRETSITGQVLGSLLAIEREEAVSFVAQFLEARDEGVPEEAALALGVSRLPTAIQTLIEYWQQKSGLTGDGVLRGLSASRQDAALHFLLALVRDAREREAIAALEALALHRDSAEIRGRLAVALESRREPALAEKFRQQFPAP